MICIDFTDLNRAYPRDLFPFPHIKAIVNVMAGQRLLFLLDVFSMVMTRRTLPL